MPTDKPLDVLKDATEPTPPDAVDAAMDAMFQQAKAFYSSAAYTMASMSAHTGKVGMGAIRERFAGTDKLSAVETIIALVHGAWAQASSSPLPTIHAEPQPAPDPAPQPEE